MKEGWASGCERRRGGANSGYQETERSRVGGGYESRIRVAERKSTAKRKGGGMRWRVLMGPALRAETGA
jgi:hypothetical protein